MAAINFGLDPNNASNGHELISGINDVNLGVNDEVMQARCDRVMGGASVMTRVARGSRSGASVMAKRGPDAVLFIDGLTTNPQRERAADGYLSAGIFDNDPNQWNPTVINGGGEVYAGHRALGSGVPNRLYIGGFSFGGSEALKVAQKFQEAGTRTICVVTFGSPMASRARPVGAEQVAVFRYMGWTDIVPSIMPPNGQAGALYLALNNAERDWARGFRHFSAGARITVAGVRTFDSVPPVAVGFLDISVLSLMVRGTNTPSLNHNIAWYQRALSGAVGIDVAAGVAMGQPLTNPPTPAPAPVAPVAVPPGPPVVVPGFMPIDTLAQLQVDYVPGTPSQAFYVRHRKPAWVVVQLNNVVAVYTKKREAKRKARQLNKARRDGLLTVLPVS